MVSSFAQTLLDVELTNITPKKRIEYHKKQIDALIFNVIIKQIKNNKERNIKDTNGVYSLWIDLGFKTKAIFRKYISSKFGVNTIEEFITKYKRYID